MALTCPLLPSVPGPKDAPSSVSETAQRGSSGRSHHSCGPSTHQPGRSQVPAPHACIKEEMGLGRKSSFHKGSCLI